jgi:hypothetical protein
MDRQPDRFGNPAGLLLGAAALSLLGTGQLSAAHRADRGPAGGHRVRILIAGNFMPVVIAGTGFITINIVIRCIIEAEMAYVTLGGMAVMTEIFFIQLARRLQDTSHEMLIFKAERERLIGELQEAMDQTRRPAPGRRRQTRQSRASSPP